MRKGDEDMWSISKLLNAWVEESEMGRRLKAERAALKWAEAVGEGIAARTRVERVEGDALIIATESPSWSSELSFRKAQIIKRLNELVGEEVIKDIRPVVKPLLRRRREVREGRPRLDFSKITPQILGEVEETTKKVSDPEIREVFRKAMLSHFAVEVAKEG